MFLLYPFGKFHVSQNLHKETDECSMVGLFPIKFHIRLITRKRNVVRSLKPKFYKKHGTDMTYYIKKLIAIEYQGNC